MSEARERFCRLAATCPHSYAHGRMRMAKRLSLVGRD